MLERHQLSPNNSLIFLLIMRSCSNSNSGRLIPGTTKNFVYLLTTYRFLPRNSSGMKEFNFAEKTPEKIQESNGQRK